MQGRKMCEVLGTWWNEQQENGSHTDMRRRNYIYLSMILSTLQENTQTELSYDSRPCDL